jgi:O-acetyl-ADP-ribose deacetylase (regulator of RNase III)
MDNSERDTRGNLMPIRYLSGDLLENENNAQAFAINCNCEGIINTIMAVQFKNRYPTMVEEYRRLCAADPPQLTPGDVFLWRGRDGQWVFNVATQDDPYLKLVNRKALEKAFAQMRKLAEENEIESIAMPPVGGGIGGLYWGKTRRIIERAFKGWKGTLYIYVKQPMPQHN